ncbi:hypothetical protein THAOC_03244, partial [Thalassiosira oceanica]
MPASRPEHGSSRPHDPSTFWPTEAPRATPPYSARSGASSGAMSTTEKPVHIRMRASATPEESAAARTSRDICCMSQSIAAALGSARADVESFWQRRYTGGQLGWHKNDVNPHLIKNLDRLLPPPSSGDEDTSPAGISVFVPLCGKSVDLAHLADHPRVSTVVGIDIVKDAAEEFAAEHPSLGVREVVLGDVCTAGDERTGLVCDDAASVGDGGPTAQRDDITFLVGDLFHFLEMDPAARAEHTSLRSDAPDERPARDGLFDAVYDRASMIAVHPSLREKYASQIGD